MSLGFWQIALIVILFLLLFGRGKIPQLMSDMAQGIKSFKSGLGDDDGNGGTEQTGTPLPQADSGRTVNPETGRPATDQHLNNT